jgi:hypothetical protein
MSTPITITSTTTISIGNAYTVPVNFKEVFSTNVKTYQVNPAWTTRQLFENVRDQILIDFETSNFELVLCGQEVIVPEMAPALTISDNLTLKNDIFGPEMRIISFYVRKVNHQYPQMANLA